MPILPILLEPGYGMTPNSRRLPRVLHPVARRSATNGVPEARTSIATHIAPCVTRAAPIRGIQQEARGMPPPSVVPRWALQITKVEDPENMQPGASRRELPSAPQASKFRAGSCPSPSQKTQFGLEEGAADHVDSQRQRISRSSSSWNRHSAR